MGFGSNGHNARVKTGFRANSNKSGTTPARDWINYPEALRAVVQRLEGVVVEARDAVSVMRQHDGPETVHYVDPPYLPETRSLRNPYDLKYRGMYAVEMTAEDHSVLLEALCALRGSVVLSGYPSPLYDAALAGWRRIDRPALADGARPRTEVLWLNDAACAAGGLFDGVAA